MAQIIENLSDDAAVELLRGLVAIPSLSGQEQEAAAWLVERMARAGYGRAYVDAAGNAVGEIGAQDAPRLLVLLGHIDTVPGAIPVRIEQGNGGLVLYGRGAVDAKGPLAAFVAAGARLGDAWARANGVRVIVVGAVEEEAASSKGARCVRDRFDGMREPKPDACIIGEPSGWSRVTLGYKGRLVAEIDAAQPMAHSAGPDAGVAVAAVELWNRMDAYAHAANRGIERAFEQLSPSLRRLATHTDSAMLDHVVAEIGVRLPPGCDANALAGEIIAWAAAWSGSDLPALAPLDTEAPLELRLTGATREVQLRLRGFEPAWRSERTTPLARHFLTAIRTLHPDAKPAFLVKTGTSDMNVVGPAWQCPIVAYGPGDSALDHTPHEHLSLTEYVQTVRILEAVLRDFASFSV